MTSSKTSIKSVLYQVNKKYKLPEILIMYFASQQLIDILVKNGFKNKSHQYIPGYGNMYSSKSGYDPTKHKRVLGVGYGKRKLALKIDKMFLFVTDRAIRITDEYTELDECKLRSIISYFKCSYARQANIKLYCSGKIEFSGQFMKEQRLTGRYEVPFDLAFENIYNSIQV